MDLCTSTVHRRVRVHVKLNTFHPSSSQSQRLLHEVRVSIFEGSSDFYDTLNTGFGFLNPAVTMATADIIQCAVVAGICFVLIMVRTMYRVFCRCRVHKRCHRQWHKDDVWMTFSLLPIIGRAITIAWSAELLNYPPGATDLEKKDAKVLSGKLLMPGRIFYLTL